MLLHIQSPDDSLLRHKTIAAKELKYNQYVCNSAQIVACYVRAIL